MADALGQRAVQPFADRIKLLPQDTPNISAARNVGVRAAAGQIVAFIDDDAVPEPTWLDALLEAFSDSSIAAATGPVLGRNGISLQWGPLAVNRLAKDIPIEPDRDLPEGFVRKLQGTNMAIRRKVFEDLGGFDEAMHFYLDDTDMALRIGRAGLRTVWVDNAVVHHGFHASVRRSEDRIPLSLFDIGASSAVFLRKHADEMDQGQASRDLEAGQSSRLLQFAKARKLDVDKMRDLMKSLKQGLSEGSERASIEGEIPPTPGDFKPFVRNDPPAPRVLAGRWFQRSRLRREAAEAVAKGQPVSLFLFEPTPRKHKVIFSQGGWWEQTGGLFGPSQRVEPRIQLSSFRARISRELRRISATRGL